MQIHLQKYIYILNTGILFYIFSERFFWSFWRIGEDNISNIFSGLLFYTFAAYSILYLNGKYNFGKYTLILNGLILGFVIEFIMVGSVYTSLFLLILFISLPWHLAISTVFGNYKFPSILNSNNKFYLKFIQLTSIALFISLWGLMWLTLPQAYQYSYSTSNFIIHNFFTTLALILVYKTYTLFKNDLKIKFYEFEGIVLLVILLSLQYLLRPAIFDFRNLINLLFIFIFLLLISKYKTNNYILQTNNFIFETKSILWIIYIYLISVLGYLVFKPINFTSNIVYFFIFLLTVITLYLFYKCFKK